MAEDTKISEEINKLKTNKRAKIAEDTKISEEINKLKTNLEKLEEIVKKANSIKDIKMNLLKEAKEDKLLAKDEIKKYTMISKTSKL